MTETVYASARPKLYLGGPIKGKSYKGATNWREALTIRLSDEIDCRSPMRGKVFLMGEDHLQDTYPESVIASDRGITTRDRNDVMTCDAVLFNLLGAETVSIGTMIEAGWADAWRKPIIVVMETHGNPHDHSMLRHMLGYRVETLDQGMRFARHILLGGV